MRNSYHSVTVIKSTELAIGLIVTKPKTFGENMNKTIKNSLKKPIGQEQTESTSLLSTVSQAKEVA